jgi:limonene-1,2-epoxide hydrolase
MANPATDPADATAIVRSFCEAWSRRDAGEIAAYFADDAVYHNIPMEPVRGAAAIRPWLERFLLGCSSVEFELLRIAASENIVFTERLDRFEQGGRRIELPVAGVFELRDGRIAAWRDYFDLATWTRQAAG